MPQPPLRPAAGQPAGGTGQPPIAVLLKGYPRLSETFIAQELLALERLGLRLRLYSLRRPTDQATHPVHREIKAPVDYLPEYLHEAPRTVLKAWWRGRRLPGYRAARAAFLPRIALTGSFFDTITYQFKYLGPEIEQTGIFKLRFKPVNTESIC